MSSIKKIFISACEVSADKYAAELAKELQKRRPSLHIIGVGSAASKAAGIDVKLDISTLSTVGVVEPIRFLPQILIALHKVKKILEVEKPDIFIPIDNQGFHMMCCQKAHRLKIPTYYFIAPQHWHWGTKKQGLKVAQVVDKVLAIFPKEATFYQQCGVNTHFVGHPCTDRIRPFREKRVVEPVCAVFPGSRKQEIERMLPVFLRAVIPFCKQYKLTCAISCASEHYYGLIETIIKNINVKHNVSIYSGDSLALMAKARVSLVTSGTVSLEHALLGVPHVVAYKFNSITYWIAKTFFKKTLERIPFMSMPNMLMNEAIFPELLQENATEKTILNELNTMFNTTDIAMKNKCDALWSSLNRGSVVKKIADVILRDN